MITKFKTTTCINEALIDHIGLHPMIVSGLFPTCISNYDRPCGDYIPYYRQPTSNLVSITQFAEQLQIAETQIENYLDTFISPTNVCNEEIKIIQDYRIESRNSGLRLPIYNHIFRTNYDCVIDYGNYDVTNVGTGVVTYLDIDGDGFKELARIDFNNVDEYDVESLGLYFQDFYNYDNEVCPVRYTEVSGDTVSFFVDSWNMVDPSRYTNRIFTEYTALDACNAEIYVDTVDVGVLQKNTCNPDGYLYYKYADCINDCDEGSVPFCAIPYADKKSGLFQIRLGNMVEGCFVEGINCDIPASSKLTRIEFNYYAGCTGCQSPDLSKKLNCNLLKRAALLIAVSRVPILNCCEQCGGYGDYWNNYQKDTNHFERTKDDRFTYLPSVKNNPFGSRLGEIEAWKIIQNLEHKLC